MTGAIDDLKWAFRDYNVEGLASSGPRKIIKPEVRGALDKLGAEMASIGSGLLRYGDENAMRADTSQDEGALAYVYLNGGDPEDAFNGFYQFVAGDWVAAPWYLAGTGITDILTLAALSTGNLLQSVKGLNVDSPTAITGVTVTTDSDDAKVGFTIAAGQTGAGAVLIAYPLHDTRTIASLAGKTIRILATYAASANFLATKGLAAEFVDIGHFVGTTGGSLVYEGQAGNLLTRLVEYTVVGNEDHLGIIALVPPSAAAGAASLSLKSVSYSLVGDNAAMIDLALAQKSAERFGLSLAGDFQNGVGQKGSGPVDSTVAILRDQTTGYANGLRILAGNTGAGNSMSVFTLVAPEDFALVRGARARLTVVLKTSAVFNRKLDILVSGHVRAIGGGALTEYRALAQHVYAGRLVAVVEGLFDAGTEQITITVNNTSSSNAAADQDWQFEDARLEIISTADGSLTGAQATMALQRNFWTRRQARQVGQQIKVALTGGDFTTLYTTFANVVAYQDINVASGVYAQTTSTMTTRPFFPIFENAIVRGVGPTRPIVQLRQSSGASLGDVEGNSASDFHYGGDFSNMHVRGRNVRYAMHADNASNGYFAQPQTFTDMLVEHEGNDDIAGAWRNCAAVGFGDMNGGHKDFLRCTFLGYDFDAVRGHGSGLSIRPSSSSFTDCVFNPRAKAGSTSVSLDGFHFSVASSDVRDTISLVGSNTNGPIRIGCSPWEQTDPALIPAYKMNISLGGHSNAYHPFLLEDDGSRALRITSATTGAGSVIVLSGTAADKLFGASDKRTIRSGATSVAARVTGFLDVGDHRVGPNSDLDIVRAGTRVLSSDVLTVKIDALATVNIPMTAGMTNAALLSAIQTALGATAVVEFANVNDRYRPSFPEQEAQVYNTTGSIIPAKTVLAWTSAGRPNVRVMTPSDPASAFAGIAYGDEILPAGWGRAKTKGHVRVTMDLLRSDAAAFAAGDTFGVSSVDGQVAVGAGAPIFTALSNVDVELNAPTIDRLATLETAVASMKGFEESVPLLGLYADLLIDSEGRPVSAIGLDGRPYVASGGFMVEDMQPGDNLSVVPKIGMFTDVIVDADGRFVWGVELSGAIYAARGGAIVRVGGGVEAKTALTYGYNPTTGLTFPTEANVVYLIVVMGQSLAGGYNSNADDNPVTTAAEHAGFALMPGTSPWPEDTVFTSLSDLREVKKDSTHNKESICSGAADAIMRRMQADLGFKPQIIFANCAWGGTSYAGDPGATGLKEGGIPWRYLQNLIVNARLTVAKQGKRLEMLNACILLGEQDTTYGTSTEIYRRDMSQWHTAFVDIVRRLNPEQNRTPLFFLSQTDRPKDVGTITTEIPVAMGQLTAPDRNPHIRTVGPIYWTDDSGDNVHPSCRAYRRIGQMFGHAICEDQFGRGFEPLKIVEAWWHAPTKIRARFTMPIAIEASGALVEIVSLGPGKGVNFDDGSGSPPAITGIALVGGSTDTIEITLAAQPTGLRQRLLVANRGTAAGVGRLAGGRSGIRSAVKYGDDPQDAGAYDLYHWACKQVFILPVLS